MWKAHNFALRAICEEHDLIFLDPPAEALGENRCLRQDFWWDVFHANEDYGHLLLRQIAAFVPNGS